MWVPGLDYPIGGSAIEALRPGLPNLVNVGSVGQPRDRDQRACYALYRRKERDIWWRRVSYDIPAAQQAIIDAGLPAKNAGRLELGR
jgi:hypothetical protein